MEVSLVFIDDYAGGLGGEGEGEKGYGKEGKEFHCFVIEFQRYELRGWCIGKESVN